MSGYAVPFSSSTPSTPEQNQSKNSAQGNKFAFFDNNPSTTPAGPPPSSAGSFTPAGPPPSSVFGSSQIGSDKSFGNSKPSYGSSNLFGSSSKPFTSFNSPLKTQYKPVHESPLRSATKASNFGSSEPLPQAGSDGDDEDDNMEEDEEQDGNGAFDNFSQPDRTRKVAQKSTSRGTKRTHEGNDTGQLLGASFGQPGWENRPVSVVAKIAKGLAANKGPPPVDEPADIILDTESTINKLYQFNVDAEDSNFGEAMEAASQELVQIWESAELSYQEDMLDEPEIGEIGPPANGPPTLIAVFLGIFLLQTRYPPTLKVNNALGRSMSQSLRMSQSSSFTPQGTSVPYPKLLLDWLNRNHDLDSDELRQLRSTRPSSTSHPDFWSIAQSALLRGKIRELIGLFRSADFKHANTLSSDMSEPLGYRGQMLSNVQRVIAHFIQTLEQCPAVTNDDWNVRGSDWSLFRRRIESSISDLVLFSEGKNKEEDRSSRSMTASHFGMSGSKGSLSQAAREAESRVPWHVYTSLRAMYGVMLGNTNEILVASQDWVETSIFLTVWWNGNLPAPANVRTGLNNSQSVIARPATGDDRTVYLTRLSSAFKRATDDTKADYFQVRTANPTEVALACIFNGDLQEAISMMRLQSLTVTTAVSEIGHLGGWIKLTNGQNLLNDFDQDDLMILDQPSMDKGVARDGILVEYAQGLFKKEVIKGSLKSMEGWELGVQVLGRVQDHNLANNKFAELLGSMQTDSADRVDKLLALCNEIGLTEQAYKVAESYANKLLDTTTNYGTILVYFARAHASTQVKNVLDLLISSSLIQSRAYPPEHQLDASLRSLVTNPRKTLSELARLDYEAASTVQTHLSGYATLRQFYDVRDQGILADQPLELSEAKKILVKKEAGSALIAVIASSSDNIAGGLYDPQCRAVVSVDGLLSLLGEAIPFINNTPRIFTPKQTMVLLRAVEDVQTVSSLVQSQAIEHLLATLASYHADGSSSSSPKTNLKKSVSSLTTASSFELTGSEMLNSGMGASGVMIATPNPGKDKVERGWDWRAGMARTAGMEDVVRILRLGLAKEIAGSWAEGL